MPFNRYFLENDWYRKNDMIIVCKQLYELFDFRLFTRTLRIERLSIRITMYLSFVR